MLRAELASGADAATLTASLRSMQSAGVQPDSQTFTVLIRAHGHEGQARRAAAVFAQLQAAGSVVINTAQVMLFIRQKCTQLQKLMASPIIDASILLDMCGECRF